MNLPGCALGPSVGPSHVVTGAVDAAMSAWAAANASPPAWAVITGAATVIGCAPTGVLSSCASPPALSTVPAAKPAWVKKLRRVHFAMVDLLSWNLIAEPRERAVDGARHKLPSRRPR